MGDVHAAMGDGELCGTGIEIPAEITVKVQLVKNFELHWPVLETHDKWYVNANAPKYDEALMNGSKSCSVCL
ncbi:MAG: acetamidase/formamidase family protein [Eggerthellaceae bacterium]